MKYLLTLGIDDLALLSLALLSHGSYMKASDVVGGPCGSHAAGRLHDEIMAVVEGEKTPRMEKLP